MLDRVAKRFGLTPKRLAGDTAYGNAQTLKRLVEKGIEPHIPVWDKSTHPGGLFSRDERKKVEMAFAHMERIFKQDRLRLRGLTGARDEVLLRATAQNLRKLVRYTGRPPPAHRGLVTSAAEKVTLQRMRPRSGGARKRKLNHVPSEAQR